MKSSKPNKYLARKTEYRGNTYDSKAEAEYAMNLDYQKKVGVIVGWTRQVRYKLVVNEVPLGAYVLDFRIDLPDGSQRYVDVKGARTGAAWQMFQWKKKLMRALFNITVEIYPSK